MTSAADNCNQSPLGRFKGVLEEHEKLLLEGYEDSKNLDVLSSNFDKIIAGDDATHKSDN